MCHGPVLQRVSLFGPQRVVLSRTGLPLFCKSFAIRRAGESSSAEDALSWQRALDPDQPGAPRDSERTWAEMAEMLKDLPVVGCHLMEFTNEVRVSA